MKNGLRYKKISNNQNKHIAYLTYINYIKRGTNSLGYFPYYQIIHFFGKCPKILLFFKKK